ncbi:hypothetical protein DSO57_1013340 [Entomophthora muscae]|uniref:Uncharacterized protein n=2 Tax=Entomophthora muscae TaxID=34485 RepID=A0ACC2U1M4_9FUNG|nr:hypothetical protein DSO57_1021202 [Entomophthora muscae]KAJ9089401.1 hypothetical protein DSO57_1013340 [Entomophthora muscae]
MKLSLFLQSAVLGAALKPTSDSGLSLIMKYEGFRPDFYLDQVGLRTIGYGHACHGDGTNCAKITAPLSKDAATSLLMNDLASREQCVADSLQRDIDKNANSALVSLAFNIGCEAYKASEVPDRINANDFSAAAKAMKSMATVAGQVVPDLYERRAAEAALLCSSNRC